MRKAEIILEFQNVIEAPPAAPSQLYAQAASNDGPTIDSWRPIWIANVKANHAKFGPFKDRSIGQLFGEFKYQPVILAGAGPSLKYNGPELKNKGGIPLISCLHNFHYLEDLGVDVDFYVTLDAGDVTIEEVYEGGTKSPEEYWERTKDKTLLAFIGASPKLLEKWQGKILFFNCPVPDTAYTKTIDELEPFHCYVSNGGNVLGACLYIAKAFLGANPVCFVGADFSFSYLRKFHAWDSKYDAHLGQVVHATDVFGNRVLSWQSYLNFKAWFDYVALQVPGVWINATEGGCLGAYPGGNISAIKQMKLADFIGMYHVLEHIRPQAEKPETAEKKILF